MDPLTTSGILYYLQTYGYLAMFILMIAESQIIVYISAFAASQGFFNIYAVSILAFLGTIIPDIILFSMGRRGIRFTRKLQKNKHIDFVKRIVYYVEEKPLRSLSVIKLLPIIPWPGIILTGTTKISFKKFIILSSVISIFECGFFLVLGFYSGIALNVFARDLKFGSYALLLVFVVGAIAWFIFKKTSEAIAKKLEKGMR